MAILSASAALGSGRGVVEPTYPREGLTCSLVHVGVGQFHRSHLAVYLDELFGRGGAKCWAIRGIGLRAEDESLREALLAQNCWYSVTEKRSDGTRATAIVGSLVDYIDGYNDPDQAVEAVADPRTRIVSLTITEGGYNVDQRTGQFRIDEPDVARDLAGAGPPRTVFGVVCEGLRRRRDRGYEALTVLSCDNVQGNGVIARRSFTGYARAMDPELADWIEDRVSFPSTMVDRITPPTTGEDLIEIRARTGLRDQAAVVCEPFRQFVVEDRFVAGRPEWERVGVQMVSDVQPYEQIKLRLLNAPHQILAHFGLLAGYTHSAEAMRDEAIVSLVTGFQQFEAMPTIPAVPGIDLQEYAATVRERFANPQMDDTLVRIATSASARVPNFILPVVRDRLAAQQSIAIAAATVAAWLHRLKLTAVRAFPITVPDTLELDGRNPSIRELLTHPMFGSLDGNPEFVAACERAARALETQDLVAMMRRTIWEAGEGEAPSGSAGTKTS